MDLKALMQKLETINKTEILTESEKKETTWTDKSGKKHPATQVKGDKYTGKEADKEAKKSKKDDLEEHFTSAIARGLVEEFGYEVEESTLTENPHANDPAKSAAWAALSPEDQKWLGGADPTDPYILARAPNKGKPAATGAATKPATTPDAAAQANRIADRMDAEAGANTAGTPPAGAATKPAVDPAVAATREKFKALLDKLEKTGGVSGSAPAPAAPKKPTQIAPQPKQLQTGAATKPAAGGATMPAVDTMGNVTGVQETVTYEDDQTLLAIKNIRY
jgi:hypothetical protein